MGITKECLTGPAAAITRSELRRRTRRTVPVRQPDREESADDRTGGGVVLGGLCAEGSRSAGMIDWCTRSQRYR